MRKLIHSSLLIGLIAVATVFLSLQAIVYYIRWFIPFLNSHHSYILPPGKTGAVWFLIKILSNMIFLTVGILLLRLFRQFRASGYFGKESLHALDFFILACLGLALLGFAQTIFDNISDLHFREWSSPWAAANRAYRFITHEFVLREPQTMYILLAAILWAVRQFVEKALTVKTENESFI